MLTPFQKKVYAEVAKIPKGQTRSYKYIAQKIKSSPRAVGQALKKNPYSYDCAISTKGSKRNHLPEQKGKLTKETARCLLIPCHRVIKSDRTIGGFNGKTSGKEIQRKSKLLKQEGIIITNEKRGKRKNNK